MAVAGRGTRLTMRHIAIEIEPSDSGHDILADGHQLEGSCLEVLGASQVQCKSEQKRDVVILSYDYIHPRHIRRHHSSRH